MIKSAKTESRSFLSSSTMLQEQTKKKLPIFVLQPNALHAQWQTDKLNSVHQLLESSHFKPNMVDEEIMLNMTDLKGKMFVIEPFAGSLFQYLKINKAWVLGPQLINTCVDHNITIPYTSYPLYSLAMQSLTICCTNIAHVDRETIRRSVAYMGGKFQTNLNANVTHLVCGTCAASEKYFVAVENGIQVMMPDWIQSVLVLSGQKTVKATDPIFDRFKCPLFYKFIISLSGFAEKDRNTIRQYIEREGATYSANLVRDKCTHLICKEPKGSKFEHAIKWRIPALKPEWIFESSEKGSCLRLINYQWQTVTTTATSDSNSGKENLQPEMKDSVDASLSSSSKPQRRKPAEEMNDLEERFEKFMNNRSKKIVDDLFDGLKVFLGQFPTTFRMRMQKILDGGCAVRFDTLNSSVTHIIRGSEPILTYAQVSLVAPNAYIVTPQWLLDCCEKAELVPETDYLLSTDRDEKQDLNQSFTDDKKKIALSTPSSTSNTQRQTGSFNVEQSILQDETPRLRRTPGSGATPISIIPEYALSPLSLLKRYSNVPRSTIVKDSLNDTPTESQIAVDRLMSDIDMLMPILLTRNSSSSSTVSSTTSVVNSTVSSSKMNTMPCPIMIPQRPISTNHMDDLANIKVSWIDASTEAERIRQHQLHNLDQMTQDDDEQ